MVKKIKYGDDGYELEDKDALLIETLRELILAIKKL